MKKEITNPSIRLATVEDIESFVDITIGNEGITTQELMKSELEASKAVIAIERDEKVSTILGVKLLSNSNALVWYASEKPLLDSLEGLYGGLKKSLETVPLLFKNIYVGVIDSDESAIAAFLLLGFKQCEKEDVPLDIPEDHIPFVREACTDV